MSNGGYLTPEPLEMEVTERDKGLLSLVEDLWAFTYDPKIAEAINREMRARGITDLIYDRGLYWYWPTKHVTWSLAPSHQEGRIL